MFHPVRWHQSVWFPNSLSTFCVSVCLVSSLDNCRAIAENYKWQIILFLLFRRRRRRRERARETTATTEIQWHWCSVVRCISLLALCCYQSLEMVLLLLRNKCLKFGPATWSTQSPGLAYFRQLAWAHDNTMYTKRRLDCTTMHVDHQCKWIDFTFKGRQN